MEEETVVNETKKVSQNGVGILNIFLLLLVVGLAFVIFGYNTKWTYKDFNFNDIFSTTAVEKTEEKETEGVKNVGWALFSLPQYKFSVEIPDYNLKQKIYGQGLVLSNWGVSFATEYYERYIYYDATLYEDSIEIMFYPRNLSEIVTCGQGCVNEHFIYIQFYRNEGKKDLETVRKIIEANPYEEIDSGGEFGGTYKGEVSTRWDRQVWSFSTEFARSSGDGYIVVTDDFVYYIEYSFSDLPTESRDIAEKVLDSITFSE